MKKDKLYFGPVQMDEAIFRMRQAQHEQAHREMVLAATLLTQLLTMNDRQYSPAMREARTRSMTDQLFGGPRCLGRLQLELERRTGLLSQLKKDLPGLRHVDLLVFSFAAVGMAEDLMAALCEVSGPDYIAVVLCRLRMAIGNLDTPRKYEYLALLGPKSCRFGEEMLYLRDL